MAWRGRFVGVAAAVVDDDGRILLVRHTYGRLNWELPGGMSEPGETFGQTALRELREETGLRAQIERLAGLYYKRENDSHHLVVRCIAQDDQPVPSSDEIADCGFFHPEELPRPISDFTVRRLSDALVGGSPSAVAEIAPLSWLE